MGETASLSSGQGQLVMECVVKPLHDVKVTGSKLAGTKNPAMLEMVSTVKLEQIANCRI